MNEFQQLKEKVERLEAIIASMESANTISIEQERALTGRGFLIAKKPPTNALTATGELRIAKQAPVIGALSIWVATSNGGANNTNITITDGIRTA